MNRLLQQLQDGRAAGPSQPGCSRGAAGGSRSGWGSHPPLSITHARGLTHTCGGKRLPRRFVTAAGEQALGNADCLLGHTVVVPGPPSAPHPLPWGLVAPKAPTSALRPLSASSN